MRPSQRALVGAAALSLCCFVERAGARVAAPRTYTEEVTPADSGTGDRLQISTTDVTTDGRFAKIRGLVENRFADTVHGVRYVVTIYQPGSPPRVLDRWQRQVDTTIAPGQRVAMRLDVDSMYFGSAGPRPLKIEAQPVILGDKPMPPPAGWR